MKKIEQPSSPNFSFSIDHWEDEDGVNVPWIEKPLLGALMVGCVVAGLFAWSAISKPGKNGNQFGSAGVPMATPLSPEMDEVDGRVHRLETGQPASRSTAQKAKGDLLALLDELTDPRKNTGDAVEVDRKLREIGYDKEQAVEHLIKRLKESNNARKFEGVAVALFGFSSTISRRNNRDLESQVISGMAAAGQYVQTQQLQGMDKRVTSAILEFSRLPESVDLLGKLASVDDNLARQVLSKLRAMKSEMASEVAVKFVKEKGLDLEYLDNDYQVVCEFLWEGKLARKDRFKDAFVGTSEASINAFAKTTARMLESNPIRTVAALMSPSVHKHSGIKRASLPRDLLQKIDRALASKVDRHLSGALSMREAVKRRENGTGPLAYLDLAEHLGGKKTAIAIAKKGESTPVIFKKFKEIRDILLSANDPETYDAIAQSTAWYGSGRSEELWENVGTGGAIELAFLGRLNAEQKAKEFKSENKDVKKQGVKRVQNLLRTVEKIGTSRSMAVLKRWANNQNTSIKRVADEAIETIRSR